jgi:hypothetical protein
MHKLVFLDDTALKGVTCAVEVIENSHTRFSDMEALRHFLLSGWCPSVQIHIKRTTASQRNPKCDYDPSPL